MYSLHQASDRVVCSSARNCVSERNYGEDRVTVVLTYVTKKFGT